MVGGAVVFVVVRCGRKISKLALFGKERNVKIVVDVKLYYESVACAARDDGWWEKVSNARQAGWTRRVVAKTFACRKQKWQLGKAGWRRLAGMKSGGRRMPDGGKWKGCAQAGEDDGSWHSCGGFTPLWWRRPPRRPPPPDLNLRSPSPGRAAPPRRWRQLARCCAG